jgi:hypothetical protein
MNECIPPAIFVTAVLILLVIYFFHIKKNIKKQVGVNCVTLETGKYSLVVSESKVDMVVTIPLSKLAGAMVVEGKLHIQFSGVSEQTTKKIVEYSGEFQRNMNLLFDKPK